MNNIRGLTRAGGVTCLLMLSGLPAFAAPSFCEDLGLLAGAGEAEVTIALPNRPTDQPAECRTALAMGGAGDLHCSWSFEYRSQAALDAFESVIGAVAECLGPDAVQSTDQQVNHPDAYDLRLFTVGGQEFAVSFSNSQVPHRISGFRGPREVRA